MSDVIDRKLSAKNRDGLLEKSKTATFRGPAFAAASIGLQELQLEVLLSIDQRLEELNAILATREV